MSLSKWLPCDFEQCHPLLWGGGILVDHWSTISSFYLCWKPCNVFIYSSYIIISKPEGVWFFIKLNVWVCEPNWTWLYSISYISMYVCIGIYYFERRGLWQHVSLRWPQGNCQLWEDCFMNQAANLEPLNLRDKYSPYTAVSSVLTTRPASILQEIDWHLQHGSTHCIQMWTVQRTVTTELPWNVLSSMLYFDTYRISNSLYAI